MSCIPYEVSNLLLDRTERSASRSRCENRENRVADFSGTPLVLNGRFVHSGGG